MAEGKPYQLSPRPNYKKCQDAGDAMQLTDGVIRQCNWLHMSTVGWRDPGSVPAVRIDLGRVEPIAEIRVHTIGGGLAGVFFPAQVLALVSDDGVTYHVASAVHRPRVETVGSWRRIPYTIRLADLATSGRFVHIVLAPQKRFVFVDEIEVIRGDHSASEVAFEASNAFALADVPAVLANMRRHHWLSKEIEAFDAAAESSASDRAAVHQAAGEATAYSHVGLEKVTQALRSARARWLQRRGTTSLGWFVANPMRQARTGDVFHPTAGENDELEIRLWQGEYESAAITIVNAGPKVELVAAVSPLRSADGQIYPSHDSLTLRRVVSVETRNTGVVGDALVKLCERPLSIESGEAGQLWLTVHDPQLTPGEYRFSIRFDASGGSGVGRPPLLTVPAKIVVETCRFPERVALSTFNWVYFNQLALPADASMADVVDDLSRHHTNTYVVPRSAFPLGSPRADGTVAMDFARFDELVAHVPDARRLLFWWGYAPGRENRHREFGHWMSPVWKARMRQYLTTWVAHLRERGIGYDRFAMYPYDESLCEDFLQFALFIKAIDPQIPIFANSIGPKKKARVEALAEHVDIWCLPKQPVRSNQARATLRRYGGKEIWRYTATGDAKSLSPYAYYRLLPWRAWAAGDSGCGFWVYARGRMRQTCNGWDDFTCTRGRWSVVYDGLDAPVDVCGEAFIPSRRWEAWREGVEDFEYLHTLRARVERARGAGVAAPLMDKAQTVLTQAVNDVLSNEADPDVVYTVRERLTAAIVELDQALAANAHDP